jgi:hypothetical protein
MSKKGKRSRRRWPAGAGEMTPNGEIHNEADTRSLPQIAIR